MSEEDKDISRMMEARRHPAAPVQVVEQLPTVGAFVRADALDEMERFADIGRKFMRLRPWVLAAAAANALGWLWVAGAITPATVLAVVLLAGAAVIGMNGNARWW